MDALDGRTSYAYDGENQCVEVWNPYGERTTWQYDGLGREQRKTYANEMVASHTYDPAGREVLLENRLANGTGIAVYTGTYDALGNRIGVTELDGTVVTYAFDESYQLIREGRSGLYTYDTTYVYDGNGNRLLKVDSGALTSYQYNVADELLLVTPPVGHPTTSTWDADGNQLTEDTSSLMTTYSWNPESRLVEVVEADGTVESYAYLAEGLRQKKASATGTTLFVWDEQNLLLETDTSQGVQARYTDLPQNWGGLASQKRGAVSSFYGFDLNWSTRILVSAGGSVMDSYSYRSFGEALVGLTPPSNLYGYLGLFGYRQDGMNQLYVRARYARPSYGRWTSRDPLFDPLDPEVYPYARNNPISYMDPDGMQARKPCPCPNPCDRDKNGNKVYEPYPKVDSAFCTQARNKLQQIKLLCTADRYGSLPTGWSFMQADTTCCKRPDGTWTGCTEYDTHGSYPRYVDLAPPYKRCIWEHEQRRKCICSNTQGDNGGYDVSRAEKDRILACVLRLLKQCPNFPIPGACTPLAELVPWNCGKNKTWEE